MMIIENYSPWGHFILQTVQGTPDKHGATEKATIPGWNVTWSFGYSTRYSTSWNFSCSKLTCVCACVCVCVCVRAPTGMSSSLRNQAPLSMEFPRQEYWSRLPSPPPGDLSNPGIEPDSLSFLHRQADSLPLAPPGKPTVNLNIFQLFRPLIY